MSEKSCLNCAFGMPEKQKQGHSCGHAGVYPRWLAESHASNCEFYKPRQNPCEADGCKWMVDDVCIYRDFHIIDSHYFTGKKCDGFKKQ